MRAIVTGGSGFIGSHLVDLLTAKGWIVENLDWQVGREATDIARSRSADAIFHLAAPVGPVGVLSWAGRLVPEVIETTRAVADAALRLGCPLVNVSTSEVYGSGQQDAESDSCHFAPETSARKEYAVAKLAAETMLRNTPGLDVRIVRPFNVAGPRQKADGGFVLPRFIAQARAGQALTVYQPGSQRRAFAHVTDIAAGIYAAYEKGKPGEVYNLGNPANACTIAQLAKEVIKAVGSGHIEIIDPTTLHGPAFREAPDKLPNIDKANAELGWYPQHDRAQIIADCLA